MEQNKYQQAASYSGDLQIFSSLFYFFLSKKLFPNLVFIFSNLVIISIWNIL